MNKVTHFEIPAYHPNRAKKFYREIFDWVIEDSPDTTSIKIQTVETDADGIPKKPGVINGSFARPDDQDTVFHGVSLMVAVEDIDTVIKKIKNAGGLIMKEKTNSPWGAIAYFKDSEGNTLSIYEPKKL